MTPSHNLLAPGAMPVIGRIFEAGAAAEAQAHQAGRAPQLPFVGQVLDYQAGASICVARRLTLDDDLFLADHNFVHATSVKPLADCFPVVPLTVSLEIMAETAACLAPGYGLIGFDGVAARRWIAVADGASLALRIEGRVVREEADLARLHIAVEVFAGDDGSAAIGATLVFGTHYASAPQPRLAAAGGIALDAAQQYAERHLFHGPRFQALSGAIAIGAQAASGSLLVRPASDLLASQAAPQLLIDPALLDGVGQLVALWASKGGRAAFPIGLGRLELYGPTPAPGTRVAVRLHIEGRQLNMLSADVEIGDGAGGMWLRISDWKSWQFKWAAQLIDFQRQPSACLLSDTQALPAVPAGLVCQRLSARRVAGFDLALLARHYLHPGEMAAFRAKAGVPARQLTWLLGRIAAKDAARAWSAANSAAPQLHPAAFAIDNDGAGQPQLRCWPAALAAPRISIAHSGEQAAALACATPVGIDIEYIAARDEHFLASFSSAAERALLAEFTGPARAAWITRLWCAKEALGKRLATGVAGAPGLFEAQAIGADHSLRLRHHPSGTEACVTTLQDADLVIAIDAPVASHQHEESHVR